MERIFILLIFVSLKAHGQLSPSELNLPLNQLPPGSSIIFKDPIVIRASENAVSFKTTTTVPASLSIYEDGYADWATDRECLLFVNKKNYARILNPGTHKIISARKTKNDSFLINLELGQQKQFSILMCRMTKSYVITSNGRKEITDATTYNVMTIKDLQHALMKSVNPVKIEMKLRIPEV